MQKKIVIGSNRRMVGKTLERLFSGDAALKVIARSRKNERLTALVGRFGAEAVVLDISRSCVHNVEICTEILKRAPKTVVVLLSSGNGVAYIFRLVDGGSLLTVQREKGFSKIVNAMRELPAAGKPNGLGNGRSELTQSPALLPQPLAIALPKMTAREREVVQLVAKGHTSAEIALELGISVRTVEAHRNNLYRKLEGPAYIALLQSAIGTRMLRKTK